MFTAIAVCTSVAFLVYFVEVILYYSVNRWYWGLGPSFFREEWQTRVSAADAQDRGAKKTARRQIGRRTDQSALKILRPSVARLVRDKSATRES
jgi:hypothetical protein